MKQRSADYTLIQNKDSGSKCRGKVLVFRDFTFLHNLICSRNISTIKQGLHQCVKFQHLFPMNFVVMQKKEQERNLSYLFTRRKVISFSAHFLPFPPLLPEEKWGKRMSFCHQKQRHSFRGVCTSVGYKITLNTFRVTEFLRPMFLNRRFSFMVNTGLVCERNEVP